MKLDFSKAGWKTDDIVYASTYRFESTPEFKQCDGWIENGTNPNQNFNCDNVAFLTKQKYKSGTCAVAECSFTGVSAPLITVAKDMYSDNGVYKYGDYFEVVIWRYGLNIWRMVMDGDKKVKHKLILGLDHALEENVRHTVSATVNGDMLEVGVDNCITVRVYMEEVYDSFHLGIDACEGICRFYSFGIENSTLPPAKIGWTEN